ncbi:MAG: copper resistance protein NlpE [Treponema sp.]|jgi:uncharacterized lipoprotein NlpE involved in copper resistance|nr:copper resistance protein NlpE [Treponema sp.]
MRKNLCTVFMVLLLIGMSACSTTANNARTSLDWEGSYMGIIPAADGPGINVQITLRADQSFTIVYNHIDRQGIATESGIFSWNENGSVITLKHTTFPPFYMVGENHLLQLDMKGKRITGKLADQYVLRKRVNS